MKERSVVSVSVEQVVVIKVRAGDGTEDNPKRFITECWSMDGKLLAVEDPVVKPFGGEMVNIEKQNLETYTRWKSEMEEKGKTPSDMVQFCRTMGQGDYADQLEAVIQEMEALLSGPA